MLHRISVCSHIILGVRVERHKTPWQEFKRAIAAMATRARTAAAQGSRRENQDLEEMDLEVMIKRRNFVTMINL